MTLHTALTVHQEYAHLGLKESHDMLQQLINLTNMLILSQNTEMAKQVFSAYESLVLEHEGTQTLDNEICQMLYGAIALSESKIKEAELHLLSAETIISEVMGMSLATIKLKFSRHKNWRKLKFYPNYKKQCQKPHKIEFFDIACIALKQKICQLVKVSES